VAEIDQQKKPARKPNKHEPELAQANRAQVEDSPQIPHRFANAALTEIVGSTLALKHALARLLRGQPNSCPLVAPWT
jgi:hypothetical protein